MLKDLLSRPRAVARTGAHPSPRRRAGTRGGRPARKRLLPHRRVRLQGFVYGIDVEHFFDSDGDGHGDLRGVEARLDHVTDLGADILWLLPFYPHDNSDNGYDVTDHFNVDACHGSMADFLRLLDAAHAHGARVVVDLVINHTSVQHPWFQRARSDPQDPHHDFYIWRKTPPPKGRQETPVFSGVEPSVWTYDRKAKAYYHHTYYRTQPDLNLANAEVRRYLERLLRFWLRLGVDGVRLDSASRTVRAKDGHKAPEGVGFLDHLRAVAHEENPQAIILGEADEPPKALAVLFNGGRRLPVLLNFYLDSHIFLGFARKSARPVAEALAALPRRPAGCQWLNFLRNLDELDLERLTGGETAEVEDAFAPRASMLAYGNGIRRRVAPMLRDPDRIRMAYALLFSLPGIPLITYGDEIGMGDDQRLPEREAVRIPMQWTPGRNGGFSQAPASRLRIPPLDQGPYRFRKVNAGAQRRDRTSLLHLVRRLARLRTRFPSLALEDPGVTMEAGEKVLVLRYRDLACAANLSDEPVTVALPEGRSVVSGGMRRVKGGTRLGPYGFVWVMP